MPSAAVAGAVAKHPIQTNPSDTAAIDVQFQIFM
jgi:hypothetical protein